jgi:hypothetical protein
METVSKALMAIDGFCCIYVICVMWLFLLLACTPRFFAFWGFCARTLLGKTML